MSLVGQHRALLSSSGHSSRALAGMVSTAAGSPKPAASSVQPVTRPVGHGSSASPRSTVARLEPGHHRGVWASKNQAAINRKVNIGHERPRPGGLRAGAAAAADAWCPAARLRSWRPGRSHPPGRSCASPARAATGSGSPRSPHPAARRADRGAGGLGRNSGAHQSGLSALRNRDATPAEVPPTGCRIGPVLAPGPEPAPAFGLWRRPVRGVTIGR
jgi:hypothetical protein